MRSILIRLGTNHPWGKGIQVYTSEGKHRADLLQRETIAKEEKYTENF
jgi:hypothetical protein